jgi:hypothetical protein
MPNTFELIASYTAGGSVSSIDFTSIPSTYTDLCLKVNARTSVGFVADNLLIKFNTSSANFSNKALRGSGSAVISYSPGTANFAGFIPGSSATASTFGNTEIYIPNYAGSTNKSFTCDSVTENNATEAYALLVANLWSQTAAINQITIYPDTSGNFVQYSTAYLFGIKSS